MELKKRETVRLDQLIKSSGQPEAVTLWSKPEENPEFMRAVQQRRVMTVIQRNVGTKRDYGLVGFFREPKAAFWIFPRKLDSPPETKVVGIKYEKLKPSTPRGPLFKSRKHRLPGIPLNERVSRPPKRKTTRSTSPAKTRTVKEFTFKTTLRITAVQDVVLETKAPSAALAMRLLKQRAEGISLDLHEAKIKRVIQNPKKLKNGATSRS